MFSSITKVDQLTRWTAISAARSASGEESFIAVRELCLKYWPAIYTYLRRHNDTCGEATELTSGFFAHLSEGNFLRYACHEHSCFRTFVLGSLEHFTRDPWQKEQALNRGEWSTFPGTEEVSRFEPLMEHTPEQAFARRWALTVLEIALGRLDETGEGTGKPELYYTLKPYLTGVLRPNYAELRVRLALSETSLKVALHRLRSHFGELVRGVVRETVRSGEETASEIRFLTSLLS